MQTVSQAKEPAATVAGTNGATSYEINAKGDGNRSTADERRFTQIAEVDGARPLERSTIRVHSRAFPVYLALLLS